MTHVHERFHRAAERFADRLAIDAGARSASYAELAARANGIASFLREAGLGPDSLVVILSGDAVGVIPTIIGALQAGCIFVPIDPAVPRQRLATLLSEIQPALIVTEAAHLPVLAAVAEQGERVPRVALLDVDEPPAAPALRLLPGLATRRAAQPVAVARDPDSGCYIYFTSGSTGRPKGILGRLRAIDHFITWEIEALGVGEGTRVSQLTTPAFDAFLRDMFTPLCAGGTVCVPPARSTVLDASKLVRWLHEQRVQLVHCVPSVFRSLLNERLDASYFPALRHVAMAGEPLLPADVKRWMDVFGQRVQLVNLYGPSETTMTKLVHFVQPSDAGRRSVPVGRPMPGAKAMVVDTRGRPVPDGTIGEIYIRTQYCSLGYYKAPDLTGEVFFANPLNDDPNDLIYKTGDFGRVLEDGTIELLGRRDHQVKIGGVRVELGEIENLLRSHELVRDVVVVDREETPGNKYLCAYVVTDRPETLDELRRFTAEALPQVMVPALFVPIESLPRTITGKVDRKALPAPAELRASGEHGYTAPRTPVEATLAGLWAQVLGTARVGVHDNFFLLGGHSLLATQLLARVFQALQVEVPLQRFLGRPTVAGLAASLEAIQLHERGVAPPPLVRVARDQRLPLSFAQQRLWAVERLQPGTAAYNMISTFRLTGELDVDALSESLAAVVQRHESLRTSFPRDAAVPCQEVAPSVAVPLDVVDLRALAGPAQAARLQELVAEESQRPFDLARAPLLRVRLVRLDDTSHVLLLNVHHIVADERSIGIFMSELFTLYAGRRDGVAPTLPALEVQYADFAAWQRQWVQGEYLEAQLRYWRDALAGSTPLLALPSDQPRPAVQSFRGAHLGFQISAALTARLKRLGQERGATLFMTLLAAFKTLLYRYSHQTDITIGTPMGNRERTELEPLIGYFAEVLVLRTDLSGNPSFARLLEQVRARTLDAYGHRHTPFEKLVELAGHERSLAFNPLFQVMFSIDEMPSQPGGPPGLQIEPIVSETGVSKFDLFLAMVHDQDGLGGTLEYSTDLFSAAAMAQMIASFQTLLEAIAADPDMPLAQLPLLTAAAREQELAGAAAARKRLLAADLKGRLAELIDARSKP
jgi:amino acid adenylation domain-containing protein